MIARFMSFYKPGVTYFPQFNLAPIAKGIAPNCSDEKFREYCKESEVIAKEILKNMAE